MVIGPLLPDIILTVNSIILMEYGITHLTTIHHTRATSTTHNIPQYKHILHILLRRCLVCHFVSIEHADLEG